LLLLLQLALLLPHLLLVAAAAMHGLLGR